MQVSLILEHKGRDVVSVGQNRTVAHAASLMEAHRIGAVLVSDDSDGGGIVGGIVGILSEREVVRGLVNYGQSCLGLPVAHLMEREVIACRPHDPITEVMARMTAQRNRHLPVMEDGRLVGIISIGDVVKHRLREIEGEADSLRDYIATA